MEAPALSMDEAKQKLAKLEDFMPNAANELVYHFGKYLAGRLNPELVPQGFVMGCELALYDLQKGVDGFTNEPIRGKLVGYPPMIYALLRMEIPRIAKAVLPEAFAKEVKDFIEQIKTEMRKERVAE